MKEIDTFIITLRSYDDDQHHLAQRHWCEVTLNLNADEWYRETANNQLDYWGLDYPPLTAYLSYFVGWFARNVQGESDLVALHFSRGYETKSSKAYLRWTVLMCDMLLFFPSVFIFCRKYYAQTQKLFRSAYSAALNESLLLSSEYTGNAKKKKQQPGTTLMNVIGHTHLRPKDMQLVKPGITTGLGMDALSLEVFLLCLMQPVFILVDHGHFQYNCVMHGENNIFREKK